MAASDTVLGRVANRVAWNGIQAAKASRPYRWRWLHFKVSAYTVFRDKQVRYTDPVTDARPRGSCVVYCIRIYPKQGNVIDNMEPMT